MKILTFFSFSMAATCSILYLNQLIEFFGKFNITLPIRIDTNKLNTKFDLIF